MRLLPAVLVLSSVAFANPINGLNSGSGFIDNSTYNFSFSGKGTTITAPYLGDFMASPGIQNCQGCNPLALGGPLLFQGGDGAATINGTRQFWSGSIGFNAISFTSSLTPKGFLAVNYMAKGTILVGVLDQFADNFTGQFYGMRKNWRVHAVFSRDANGGWDFVSERFATVPEPGSLALLGTGLLAVWKLRRRG